MREKSSRSSRQSGAANPFWKGGRSIASNGYVLIKRPDHPRADTRGYVYEHRLVAEEKLGRPLLNGEIVHHINHDKTDNRPENIATMLPAGYWPNVWLGTSTEDQQRADERIPILIQHVGRVPVLFLSVEPQLGPIELGTWFWSAMTDRHECAISWVITGGESGPRHRPFDLDWARRTRDECAGAGVAFHFKQIGGLHHAAGGCLLDGREHKAFPEPRREFAHA